MNEEIYKREFKDLVDSIKKNNKKCLLFIGAGCSVSAGIPGAKYFEEKIFSNYNNDYNNSPEKSFNFLMREIGENNANNLINDEIKDAKLNFAHIAIAQLIEKGIVDVVLTTNFDRLIRQACALINLFPTIYDFTISNKYNIREKISPSIFHLHGQFGGFSLFTSVDDFFNNPPNYKKLLIDLMEEYLFVIVGYSGGNDPVFSALTEIIKYKNKLFWVSYNKLDDTDPVLEKLCIKGKSAYHIEYNGADPFFVNLSREFDCFPPTYLSHPFSFGKKTYDLIMDYGVENYNDSKVNLDLFSVVKNIMSSLGGIFENSGDTSLISSFVNNIPAIIFELKITVLFANINLTEIVREYSKITIPISENAKKLVASSFNTINYWNQKKKDKTESEIKSIENYYKISEELLPTLNQTLINFGLFIEEKATNKNAKKIFSDARKKYNKAIKNNPEDFLPYYYLGSSYLRLSIFQEFSKHEENANNAIFYLKKAYEKNPNFPKTLLFWGNALELSASQLVGEKAKSPLKLAGEKYGEATKLDPNNPLLYKYWASCLMKLSFHVSQPDSASMKEEALIKIELAHILDPSNEKYLIEWSGILINQSYSLGYSEKQEILLSSIQKSKEANILDSHSADYNIACAYSLLERPLEAMNYLIAARDNSKLPRKEYILVEKDFSLLKHLVDYHEFIDSLPDD